MATAEKFKSMGETVNNAGEMMASVRDMRASDVVDDDPVTVNIGQTLSKLRNKMETRNLRTVPVVDGEQFVGMLSYRELIEKVRSDPSSTKVDSLLHTPPTVDGDQNVVELSRLRIDSGRKKFAMTDEHGRLTGVVGEQELVYPVKETDELQNLTVEDLMTADVITVAENTAHETARTRMMDNNISRLPVVNDSGNLTGIVTSTDLLRTMVPREQMKKGDFKGDIDSLSDISVHEVMQHEETVDATIIRGADTNLQDVIDALEQNNALEVVVVEDDTPVGILTLKDVIDHVASFEAVDSIHVQLTGPDVPEEKQVILDKVETAVRGGLGRVLRRPEELTVHVKKYEEEGERHKYSLRFKLVDASGVRTVKTHGWDLLDAVDEGLDELETVVKKEKEKQIDRKRDEQRESKYSG